MYHLKLHFSKINVSKINRNIKCKEIFFCAYKLDRKTISFCINLDKYNINLCKCKLDVYITS